MFLETSVIHLPNGPKKEKLGWSVQFVLSLSHFCLAVYDLSVNP